MIVMLGYINMSTFEKVLCDIGAIVVGVTLGLGFLMIVGFISVSVVFI